MPDISCLVEMISGVPVVTAPAEIDVAAANARSITVTGAHAGR